MEIVLPKQVCQELVYGHAVKPHPPAPPQSYSSLWPACYLLLPSPTHHSDQPATCSSPVLLTTLTSLLPAPPQSYSQFSYTCTMFNQRPKGSYDWLEYLWFPAISTYELPAIWTSDSPSSEHVTIVCPSTRAFTVHHLNKWLVCPSTRAMAATIQSIIWTRVCLGGQNFFNFLPR